MKMQASSFGNQSLLVELLILSAVDHSWIKLFLFQHRVIHGLWFRYGVITATTVSVS